MLLYYNLDKIEIILKYSSFMFEFSNLDILSLTQLIFSVMASCNTILLYVKVKFDAVQSAQVKNGCFIIPFPLDVSMGCLWFEVLLVIFLGEFMIQNGIINNSELVNGILFIFSISYQYTKINLRKSQQQKQP